MNVIDIIAYLIISFVTGTSIGLVGIGAGVLLIPMLVTYGVQLKTAISIGLILQLVPQSAPGLYLYFKDGVIDVGISMCCIIGSTLGILLGSYMSTSNVFTEITMYRFLFFLSFTTSLYIGYYNCNFIE